MTNARQTPLHPVAGHRTEAPALTVDKLRDIGLFGALSDEVLAHLTATLKQTTVMPGDTIFREGEPAHEMFALLDGEVEVVKKSRVGREHRIALLGPSDSFGEMSVVDMQPRSATVRAVAPSRVLRMSTEDMDALYRHDLKSYALITLNIARDLSRRLRVTDGILAEFTANVLDEYVSRARTRLVVREARQSSGARRARRTRQRPRRSHRRARRPMAAASVAPSSRVPIPSPPSSPRRASRVAGVRVAASPPPTSRPAEPAARRERWPAAVSAAGCHR